ncbi:MAG: epoxyqueuosine reductase QueH [Deferribacterota bacterium]|nr:epoxyqueuosine reductase QueH [Deferribacterota bacterium]
MDIILHQCCGPCSIYPIECLINKNFNIIPLFYNPNIHPYTEFLKRLDNAKRVNNIYNIKGYYNPHYDIYSFTNNIPYNSPERCYYCYNIRLKYTAEFAKKLNVKNFTTTLLYSKYQDHESIIGLSKYYAKEFNLGFYYEDFRKGWKEGIIKSKEYNIYRQNYLKSLLYLLLR